MLLSLGWAVPLIGGPGLAIVVGLLWFQSYVYVRSVAGR
jgi:hypothetical protein